MLSLNLISAEAKQEIKLRHLHGQLKSIDFILIIATIIAAIMFLTAKIILQNTFNSVVEQTTLLTQNSQSYNLKVREINSKINSVEKIQNQFIGWSDLLAALAEIRPAGVYFSLVRANQADQSIKLAGRAVTREALINFKTALEQSALFSGVTFPIANFLEKTDINFDINAKINLEKL